MTPEQIKSLKAKNAYYRKQVPLLKKRIDKTEQNLETMTDAYRKEIKGLQLDLQKSTELYDQLQEDFNIISGIGVRELLGMVAPRDTVDGSGLPLNI